jgi:hypothetical protein
MATGHIRVGDTIDQCGLGLLEALGDTAAGLLDGLKGRIVLALFVIWAHDLELPARSDGQTPQHRQKNPWPR